MSNALAIASVSAVLKDLLHNAAIDHQLSSAVGNVTVSALPPDRVLIEGTTETSRINLFMYQVTLNQGWRNVDLPSRDASGQRTDDPPLGLDLHYLISAYGASELHAEILLGYALQLLHETPILTRDAIRRTLAPASPVTGSILPPPLDTLTASELADQVEQIRLTPEPMSVEEISKLWGAIQSHYRPTAAYQASVVLIESRRSTRSALPVGNDMRRIYVVPFRFPHIDRVANVAGDLAPIAVGTTLEIRGRDLLGDETLINLDGIELSLTGAATPESIGLPLTSPLPAGLYAGVKGVQVLHRMKMGDPATDHRGFESNVAAFVLRPTITNGPVILPADVLNLASSTEMIDGVTVQLRAGELRVKFDPKVGKEQRVTLLLNELNAVAGARPNAYSFRAPAGNGIAGSGTETGTIRIPFQHVVAGTYLVRVQVNGAESLVAPDGTGLLTTPHVVLP